MNAPVNWNLNAHATHDDPLLDCLAALTRIHGQPWTNEALAAGLPLVENRLTPSLLSRAANRAGLSVRLVRQPLEKIRPALLPAIILLVGQRACLLLDWTADGRARVRFPEGGETESLVSQEALAKQYAGVVAYVRPRFRFEARVPEVGQLRGRHWFWGVVLNNWRLYRDALLASVAVNIFSLSLPLFTMNVYDRVVPNHAEETLWVLTIGILFVFIFDFCLRTLRAFIIDTAGKRIDVTLSSKIMERVLGLRMEARPESVGSFSANLRAFESVRDFIASATITAVVDLPFALLFVIVLVWLSPWLPLPPLIGGGLAILVALVVQHKLHALTESTYRASGQRQATLVEALVGLETVKTQGAEGVTQRNWERATLFIAQVGTKLKLLSTSVVNFTSAISQLVSVSTVVLGVYLLMNGQLSMGGIIAASMLAGRMLAPLGQIAGLLLQYHNARTALAGIETQMKLPIERPEGANFLHRPHFRGEVEFRNVAFTYPSREQPVLRNVSFRLAPGEKAAIIGRIGSGKSTLEKLVLGLYQPTEGAVLIDGIDSRQIDPAELRRAIGFVPQDVVLFYGSLRHNIAFGAPFAEDSAVIAAADLAGVTEFANAHPRGFDMLVGERGESLSGGQRQSVAIARAMLNDPPILLFDEPSSNMDHQSEERLKQRLSTATKGKTMLLITHRTSLLDLVDRLIVIDGGQIVADGPKANVIEALQSGRVGRAA